MVHTAPAGTLETREQPPGGRSARKRQAIVEAATALFLEHGYQGTSMDDIAALAAVSKQTVYKNFADKQQLFSDIVLGAAARADAFIAALPRVLADTDDLEAGLRALARQYLAIGHAATAAADAAAHHRRVRPFPRPGPRLLRARARARDDRPGGPVRRSRRTAACCASTTRPSPPATTRSWSWAWHWTGPMPPRSRGTACPPPSSTARPTRPPGPSSPPTGRREHAPGLIAAGPVRQTCLSTRGPTRGPTTGRLVLAGHADGMNNTTMYVINAILVLMVVRQIREHPLDLRSLAGPVLAVGAAAVLFLHSVPGGGNESSLELACVTAGAATGALAGLTTKLRRGSGGRALGRAGWLAASLWITGVGARMAFAVASHNGAGPAIARFSIAHQITGSAAWIAALIMMAAAPCPDLASVVIYVRGRRLTAAPAVLAAPPPAAVRAGPGA